MLKVSPEYAAGFFDGEGYVSIWKPPKNRSTPRLHVGIGQVDRHVLDLIQVLYGGSVQGPFSPTGKAKANARDFYYWALSGRACEKFLVSILPYTWVKRARIELGLEFLKLCKGDNLLRQYWSKSSRSNIKKDINDFVRLQRWSCYYRMKDMNKRGRETMANAS